MMKMSRQTKQNCCFSGCTGALIIFGGLAILLFSEPPRPKSLELTDEQRKVARDRANQLKTDFKQIARDIQLGKKREFHMEIGQHELNEVITTDPEAQRLLKSMDLRDPYVIVEPGRIKVTVTRAVTSFDVTSTVDFLPRLIGERVEVFIDSSRTGTLRMPDMITRRFGDRLAAKIKQKISQDRVKVRSLKVETGRILVDGSTS